MSEETKKYIVTSPNCAAGEVGEQVELTDEKAQFLVNQVRPADAPAADGGSAAEQKLATALAKAQDRIKELGGQLAAVTKERDDLIEALSKAGGQPVPDGSGGSSDDNDDPDADTQE